MKVKFRYGIKSYSGTLDELNFANYEERNVVIGRMLPVNREITSQNILIGGIMVNISNLYGAIEEDYKADLKAYSKKMYKLKKFDKQLAGNRYSTFVKMLFAASKDPSSSIDINSLSVDDLSLGAYEEIQTVANAVRYGYLPAVDGYELYTASITA